MKHGVYASFMPKPMADAPGNGMHVHQSLMDRSGNNVFFDPDDPSGYNLSATAKSYIAGLLKYAPEYTLVTNQYVNSYKRLQPGGEAPTCISWGARNRSTLCASQAIARTASRPVGWSCAAPTRRRTPIWPSPSCWPRGWRASRRGLSSCPRRRGRAHRLHALRASGAGHRDLAGIPRRGRGALRGKPPYARDLGRAHPRLPRAHQARGMGGLPGHRDRVGARAQFGGVVACSAKR